MNQDRDLDDAAVAPDLEPEDEEVAAVAAEVVAMNSYYRELHRQSDTKAGQCLTVVGLVLAAATAVVPRLDGVALVLAAIAVVAVVIAGVLFGFALKPAKPNSGMLERGSLVHGIVWRIRDPRLNLEAEVRDLVGEVNFVSAKHHLIRRGMSLLWIAFLAATAAAFAAVMGTFS